VALSESRRSGDPALQPLGEAAWGVGILISRLLRLLRLAAGNDDYDYDEGRSISISFFFTRCSREKNLLIPAAAVFFSLDATLGLVATRRRLGRRGDFAT